ncbi:MAG: hypothetical protein HY746_05535, partial [Elusimicrobia bacterium]|nr:hypothetical protein [Elusimicrobiota bacterium]
LSASAKDPAITEKAKEAFLFLTSEVVMLNYALYDEKEHGLAIYMPSQKFYKSFRNLSFANDTSWDELIKTFLK